MTQIVNIVIIGKYKLSTPTLLYALIPFGIRKNTSFPEVFFLVLFFRFLCIQCKTDSQRHINPRQYQCVQMAHLLPQSRFVNSPHLLQKNHRILYDSVRIRLQRHMGGKFGLIHSGGYRRTYHRRAVAVSHIVLYNKNRSHAPLFGTHDRPEICIINIASSDCQCCTLLLPYYGIPHYFYYYQYTGQYSVWY